MDIRLFPSSTEKPLSGSRMWLTRSENVLTVSCFCTGCGRGDGPRARGCGRLAARPRRSSGSRRSGCSDWYGGKARVPMPNCTLHTARIFRTTFLLAVAPRAVAGLLARLTPGLGAAIASFDRPNEKDRHEPARLAARLRLPASKSRRQLPTTGQRERKIGAGPVGRQRARPVLVDLSERTGALRDGSRAHRAGAGRAAPRVSRRSAVHSCYASRAARPSGCRATRSRCHCRCAGLHSVCRRSLCPTRRCRCCCRRGVRGGAVEGRAQPHRNLEAGDRLVPRSRRACARRAARPMRCRLEPASTHWLRHVYAKCLAEGMKRGLDARAALDNMGTATRGPSTRTLTTNR